MRPPTYFTLTIPQWVGLLHHKTDKITVVHLFNIIIIIPHVAENKVVVIWRVFSLDWQMKNMPESPCATALWGFRHFSCRSLVLNFPHERFLACPCHCQHPLNVDRGRKKEEKKTIKDFHRSETQVNNFLTCSRCLGFYQSDKLVASINATFSGYMMSKLCITDILFLNVTDTKSSMSFFLSY